MTDIYAFPIDSWEFPKDRFVTYEKSDEVWARPLGLGKSVVNYIDGEGMARLIQSRVDVDCTVHYEFDQIYRSHLFRIDKPAKESYEMVGYQWGNAHLPEYKVHFIPACSVAFMIDPERVVNSLYPLLDRVDHIGLDWWRKYAEFVRNNRRPS